MPLKQDRLERILKLAQNNLSLCEQGLKSQDVPEDQWKKNPRWRSLKADCRQIEGRIQSASDLETRGQAPVTEESSEESEE